MNRLTVMPFLLAMFAAVAAMPTNVYQICAWNVGTLEVEPWRTRTAGALRRAAQGLRAWVAALRLPSLATAGLVVLLIVLVSHATAEPAGGVLMAAVPAALVQKRAQLIAEADRLRAADGTFKSDEDRAAFDAKTRELADVNEQIRKAEETGPPASPEAGPPASPEAGPQAAQAERQRVLEIQDICRKAGLAEDRAATFIKAGTAVDAVRKAAFDELAKRTDHQLDPNGDKVRVEMGDDARDKFLRGASNWLLVKGGAAEIVARAENPTAPNTVKLDPGEFRGFSLVDLARESLERAGVRTRGMSKMDLVGKALTHRATITQSTSDFATLLENVMHKILQASYATAPDTWSRWCNRSTVTDFRAHNRYRMGMFGALDAVSETGEFKNKAINDAEKATITAATKGNIINVSRQMIVNDDVGAFTRLLQMLGRAAGLSVEVDAYALLGQNSGLGPTQSDSQPLFNANRSNVGTGAAITVDAIDADRVVMASQKDPWGNEYLDLRPAVLLVPIALGGSARVINDAQYDPDTANKLQRPNKVRGLFREVVDTPRLSGTRRYLFADPSVAPVFEVAFLEGQSAPVLESQDGWRVDGTEMKVRFDYGVAAVDYRGAVTNAGA